MKDSFYSTMHVIFKYNVRQTLIVYNQSVTFVQILQWAVSFNTIINSNVEQVFDTRSRKVTTAYKKGCIKCLCYVLQSFSSVSNSSTVLEKYIHTREVKTKCRCKYFAFALTTFESNAIVLLKLIFIFINRFPKIW